MSDAMNHVNKVIDDENAGKSAHTRRQMVAGAGAVIGGMGLMGLASGDALAQVKNSPTTAPGASSRPPRSRRRSTTRR